MSLAARGIEEFFRQRYGREAIYLPSGRLALYLAFREWLRPSDLILMSPVNDDVVFFTVLAAGLVPVLGPIDPDTGNLDPSAIDESTWIRLRGVMTTNLYGIPDRMDLLEERCKRHDLVLIEDACQALDSRFAGRRIGEFSPVAAFSLTKHIAGEGGVLVFKEGKRYASLAQRARDELRRRTFLESVGRKARCLIQAAADATGSRETLRELRERWVPRMNERVGHRMPYDALEVLQARKQGGGLDRFERWVRVDNHDYRTVPFSSSVRATLRKIEEFDENRRRRIEGARKLVQLGFTPSGLSPFLDTALFRVPLFVRDRDRILLDLARRGLVIDYIYDPPLDLYADETLAERLPSPPRAERWARNVLPVDPLNADRFVTLLEGSRVPVSGLPREVGHPERVPDERTCPGAPTTGTGS